MAKFHYKMMKRQGELIPLVFRLRVYLKNYPLFLDSLILHFFIPPSKNRVSNRNENFKISNFITNGNNKFQCYPRL